MKKYLWILALLIAVPVTYGQDAEDGIPPGAQFALGNLSVQQLTRTTNPVQEFTAFFAEVKLPLTKKQQRQLPAIIDAYQRELEIADPALRTDDPASVDARKKINQAYMKRVNDVLSPEQQSAWRHYRTEQIRLRGGYPALASILEQSGVPLAGEQDKSIRQIFENFEKRRARVSEANTATANVDMDRLAIAEFNRVVALLTPPQRQALQALRRRSSFMASTH